MEKHFAEITEKRRVIFNDFITHYNSSNRGINSIGRCCYSSGCAIGRLVPIEIANSFDKEYDNPCVTEIFEHLPSNLKDLGCEFLQDIQIFHDDSNNFNEHGLSNIGKLESERLQKLWHI